MARYHQSARRAHVEMQRLVRRQARRLSSDVDAKLPPAANFDRLMETDCKHRSAKGGAPARDFYPRAWEREILLMASSGEILNARAPHRDQPAYWIGKWAELARAASAGDPRAGALAWAGDEIELPEGGVANAFFAAMIRTRAHWAPHSIAEAVAAGSVRAMGGPVEWLGELSSWHAKNEVSTRLHTVPSEPAGPGAEARSRLIAACGANRRFMAQAVLGATANMDAPRGSWRHLRGTFSDRSGVHALVHIASRFMLADPTAFSSVFSGAVRAARALGRDPAESARGMVDRAMQERSVFDTAENGIIAGQSRGLGGNMPAALIAQGEVALAACLAESNLLPDSWTGPRGTMSEAFYRIALSFWEARALSAEVGDAGEALPGAARQPRAESEAGQGDLPPSAAPEAPADPPRRLRL